MNELSRLSGNLVGRIGDLTTCLGTNVIVPNHLVPDPAPLVVNGEAEHPTDRGKTVVLTFTFVVQELAVATYKVTDVQGLTP